MRLVWAEGAIADLVQIRAYIAEHNPQAAGEIALHLLQSAELLFSHPKLGLSTQRTDIRRLVVSNSVYSLIYRLVGDDVEIIEVFDGRRRKPRTGPVR